jgi:hypothetical protein
MRGRLAGFLCALVAGVAGPLAVAAPVAATDVDPPVGTVAVNEGSDYTRDRNVTLSVAATDAGSGVSLVSVSNDGSAWTEMAYAPELPWTLPSGDGPKAVLVKWRDGSGLWSPASTTSIVLDTTAPSGTAPTHLFVAGSTVTSTGLIPTRFSWSAVDAGSGIARYEAAITTDDGPHTPLELNLASPVLTLNLAAGHTYGFRARAVDLAGNNGPWLYGQRLAVNAYQEGSSRFTWKGAWTRPSNAGFWSGRERASTAAGAKVTFTSTGHDLAWIGSMGASRGSANVYVDGVLVQTVSLYSSTTRKRRVITTLSWSTAANRTIRIVVSGTAGHPRVDLDAFVTGSKPAL